MSRLRRFLDVLPRPLRRQKLLVALWGSHLVDPVQLLEFNGGARAWVDLRDAESRASYLSRSFWPEFPPMVAAFLGGGGDLFDVGANFGLVTFGVLPLVEGRGIGCHLFEANPRIVPLLERSAALWPRERISVIRCCVSDSAGASRLAVTSTAWGQAVIAAEGVEVPNLVLDDYIADRRIERIAFLKMDVNGWEPHALRGAARALAAGRIEAAFVEVVPAALAEGGASAAELLAMMRDLGFDAYFCALWDTPDPFGLAWVRVPIHGTRLRFARAAPLPPAYVQGDVLFVHRAAPYAEDIRRALAGGA